MAATVLKSSENGLMGRFYWQEYHDSISVGLQIYYLCEQDPEQVGIKTYSTLQSRALKPSISVAGALPTLQFPLSCEFHG